MYVVALTRSAPSFEADLGWLASLCSLTPYDLGSRARGGLPALLGCFSQSAEGESVVAKLRDRGYGAVACETATVASGRQQIVPREFRFNDGVLSGVDDTGKPFELALSQVVALIRATSIATVENNTTTQTKQLALGRALVTGGLVMSKKVEHTSTSTHEAREQVLYLFINSGLRPLCFKETMLRYQGLGAAIKPTVSQNFATLVETLRANAPEALYDDRFLKQKRKVGIASISAGFKDFSVSSSNVNDNDLGAHLLLLAHAQGQL